MKTLIRHITKYDAYYFWGTIAVLVLSFGFLKKPGFDGSFESIGIKENHYIHDLKYIDSLFHEDRKIFVEVIPKDTTLSVLMSDMNQFEQNLKQNFDTISFRSVLKLSRLFYNHKQRKKIPVSKALAKFSQIPLFKDLIGRDKKSFLVILSVHPDSAKIVVDKYQKSIESTDFQGVAHLNVTSEFHIEDTINEVLIHDLGRIILGILISFILIMLLAYRSLFSIIYLMFIVILTLVATFFVFQQFDLPFNLITLMVLPVVVVLSVADGVHLLTGMGTVDSALPKKERIQLVYHKYMLPSFLTSLTTAVAFLTLGFNDTASVVDLGQITGISVLVSYLICYLTTPFIFRKWYRPGRINQGFFVVTNLFHSRVKLFSYLLFPLIVVAIFLIPKLRFKNDFEIFLPLHSEAKIQHDEIKNQYYSQAAIELAFRLKDTLNKSATLTHLTHQLEQIDGVNLVRSVATNTFVKGNFMIPIDISKFSGYKKRFETKNGLEQRMQVRVTDPNRIPEIENDLRKTLKDKKLSDIRLTSPALIFSYVNKEVARSLIRSLVFSTLFLIIVFYFLTKDLTQALIGMFANIVPLSVIVIIFVWFDLNINIVTAMTAVICIGLIVDDTIHAFYRKVVLKESLNELGFGMLTTTIILVVGFGMYAISSIKPIVIFGLVSSAVFVITLISDLTLLFYLLEKYEHTKKKKELNA